MKILKNIIYTLDPAKLIVGYSDDIEEFKTKELNLDEEQGVIFDQLTEIVEDYGGELKYYLCQITPDQHMCEERIRYVKINETYEFIPIDSLKPEEKQIYDDVKVMLTGLLETN